MLTTIEGVAMMQRYHQYVECLLKSEPWRFNFFIYFFRMQRCMFDDDL